MSMEEQQRTHREICDNPKRPMPSVFALVHSNIRITMSLALIFGPLGVLGSILALTLRPKKKGPRARANIPVAAPSGPKNGANIYDKHPN